MTTTTQPAPEPHYVTRADLEAFEGRVINRLAEQELRLTRDSNTAFWRMVALILPLYALWLGTLLAFMAAALNIISRLPAQP